MPRKAKKQAPQAPNAQAYGERGDQIAAQQEIPLPNTGSFEPAAAQTAVPVNATPEMAAAADPGALSPPPQAPMDPFAAAQAMPPPDAALQLAAPTARPDEPLTAGLPVGPGPGPEAIGLGQAAPQNPLLDTLRLLAESDGTGEMQSLLNFAARRYQ